MMSTASDQKLSTNLGRASEHEIEVEISGLMLDPVTNMPIVVLKDMTGQMVLPIWVGLFEAKAIQLELEKVATPRPMTHDLLRNLARGLGAVVERVVITDLREDTFYAAIWMTQAGESVMVDARPSDAIALALRWDCPIFLSPVVLGKARPQQAAETGPKVDPEELRKWLENLDEDDTGRYKM